MIAVYVHIPFCPSKCGYCDFNSYAMDGEIKQRTTDAIRKEILQSPWRGVKAKTVFFGGGTPTFLEQDQLLSILDAVAESHPIDSDIEVTSEANPGTVDTPKFAAMRQAGFNRISLGVQSFQEDDLLTLGRVHKSGEIERAVLAAREAGFESLNLDLMFALPNQSLHGWRANLDRALALNPDHLSLYCLTIEENTAFYKQQLRGQLQLPDEDSQVEMYEECVRKTAEREYVHYEISNFARPGMECRHNLCYWRTEDYAGYGPGAVGCVDGVRYTNTKHPVGYSERVENGQPVPFESEKLTEEDRRLERIMLGLRLAEGLPVSGVEISDGGLKRCIQRGWVSSDQDRLYLTQEGKHFCSEVALELVTPY
jgi:oxygen-independent coproporphyrinogen-3 oxidase